MSRYSKIESLEVLAKIFPNLKKICLVTNRFPPYPENVTPFLGGISRKYEQLIKELRYRNKSFSVISLYFQKRSRGQDAPHVYRVGTYHPYTISKFRYFYPLLEFFNFSIFMKCVRIFQKENPGVILIGETKQMSLSPIFAAKILGLKVVIEHDWICPVFPKQKACNLIERIQNCGKCLENFIITKESQMVKILFGIFSAFIYLIKKNVWNRCLIIAESNYFKELYIQWGIRSNVIYKAPPHPTVNTLTPYDPAFKVTLKKLVNNSKVLVYVGRLSPEKGIRLLFQSYKLLKIKNEPIKLIVAGDGPLRNFVIKENEKDSDILYLGWLSPEKLKCVYSLADIVLIPSTGPESYPHVALEALSFGKKVIGFEMGGLIEIAKENPRMKLVKNLNPADYANAIIKNIRD